MPRYKDHESDIPKEQWNWHKNGVIVAALWDIRDQLRVLNGLLNCRNFTRIPTVLDDINKNTTKPKRKIKR